MSDTAKLRVVVWHQRETRWGPGDVVGELRTEDGEKLWGHYSSSVDFLVGDLTTTFTKRRVELETRFPDGYELTIEEHHPGEVN